MDKKLIREIPFELADIVDRPPLKRLDAVEDPERRARLRANFAARTAAAQPTEPLDIEVYVLQLRSELERLRATLDRLTRPKGLARRQSTADVLAKPMKKVRAHVDALEALTEKQRVVQRERPRMIEIEVVKGVDGWIVKSREGAQVGLSSYGAKRDAIEIARRVAREARGELSIHDLKGNLVEHRSYGRSVLVEAGRPPQLSGGRRSNSS